MIIYIHGYGSSGLGFKARHLQKAIQCDRVLCPSLPKDTRLAVHTLKQLIEAFKPDQPVGLIGASWGGYLALYLAGKYHLPALLINPAIPPWPYYKSASWPQVSGERFQWTDEILQRLSDYRVDPLSSELKQRLLLLQELDDEVLDAQIALDYLSGVECHLERGARHQFKTLAKYDNTINHFFTKHLLKTK